MVTNTFRIFSLFVFLIALTLPTVSCEKSSGILIGELPGSSVQRINSGEILTQFFNYVDSTVLTELTFKGIWSTSPKKGFLLIETKQDLGKIWVLANGAKHGNKIRKLGRGEKFQVCGIVTAIVRTGQDKSEITVLVE